MTTLRAALTLTVIVPCYNSAADMRRCLDSILAADAPDVEIIVVDDGSHDATGEIADEYAERHAGRVRAVHKPNGGHGSTINVGLELANGRYFKVVDSDDWVDVAAFGQLLATLRRFEVSGADVDMVLSNFVYEKEGRRAKRTVRFRRVLPRVLPVRLREQGGETEIVAAP